LDLSIGLDPIRYSSNEQKYEVKRIKYLFVGLNSYAKYLKRNLNLDINRAKIYPKIISLASQKRHDLIKSMNNAFSDDIDKLKSISCIETFLNVSAEQILIEEPIGEKIKQLTLLLIPIIAVAISVIQLFLRPGK
jgi:hypothetical protein